MLSHAARYACSCKVKVSYEKVSGTKGGTASVELRQSMRAEPTLDEQLTSLVSCRH